MRLAILFAAISSLSLVVGCGSSQSHPTTPGFDDPSWVPPGQLNFAISESATKEAAPTKSHGQPCNMKPNHREIVLHGKVHAAR